MSREHSPHLFLEKDGSSTLLRYTGHPKATYIYNDIKEGPDGVCKYHFLCKVSHIRKVTIQPKYLLIKATAITIRIPHTEQTYSELQNIMKTHEMSLQ